MKRIQRLALLLTILVASANAHAQVSTPDAMIRQLFTTLKNKDEKSFVALYPNGQQMSKLVRGMMETMFKSEEMQKMMAMDEKSKNMNLDSLIDAQVAQMAKPEAQAEMQKSFAKSFQAIIAKGEKKGVNWSQAEITSFTMDSTAESDDQDMKMFAGAGMKTLKGVIDFTAGGTPYQMSYEKVLYLPSENGWFGGEFKQVIKKGESFAQEGGNDDAVTTEPAKTKVKADSNKTKAKTKTPTTKTKTKTKS